MTLEEIAAALNTTFEDVRDTYRSALRKLSHHTAGRKMLAIYEQYESERAARDRNRFRTPYARSTRRASIDVPDTPASEMTVSQ
jgi:hypothetical protein